MSFAAFVRIVLFLPITTLCCATTVPAGGPKREAFRRGDLIFLDLDCTTCAAIASVTAQQFGVEGPRLSHVGLIDRDERGRSWVIEAWPQSGGKGGVVRTRLEEVISRVKAGRNRPGGYYLWQPCPAWRPLAQRAVAAAQTLLGAQYDQHYVKGDGRYYCSELVQEAYRRANGGRPVFFDRPMTFGGAESAARRVWLRYFAARNTTPPEGKPGISPLGVYLRASQELCRR